MLSGLGMVVWPQNIRSKRRGPASVVPEPPVPCRAKRVNADQGIRESGGWQRTSFATAIDSGKPGTRSPVRRIVEPPSVSGKDTSRHRR